MSLSERLQIAINSLGLSKTETAKQIGISPQTLNYILTNNLNNSKFAPKIAAQLGINLKWLLHGTGKFEEVEVYSIPLFNNLYVLENYLNGEISADDFPSVFLEEFLGPRAFGYLMNKRTIIVCFTTEKKGISEKYFCVDFDNNHSSIQETPFRKGPGFPVYQIIERFMKGDKKP